MGDQLKVTAKVSGKKISLVLKAKPIKTKKVKATVTAFFLVKGTNAEG